MKKPALLASTVAVTMVVAFAALGLGSVAYAGQKVKAKEMTCEEFLTLGDEVQPRVVYWLDGYSKSGKLEDREIDVESFDRPIAMVVTECRKAPKASLVKKIEDYF